jgi:hypothetical protein
LNTRLCDRAKRRPSAALQNPAIAASSAAEGLHDRSAAIFGFERGDGPLLEHGIHRWQNLPSPSAADRIILR